jgi:hypothetical protein
MAAKLKTTKRSPRIHPCKPAGVPSKGLRRGARPTRLTPVQLAAFGRGMVDSIESVEVRQTFGRWMADRQRIILGER